MSIILTCPDANISALFGVATGNMNAKLTDKVIGSMSSRGCTFICFAFYN